MTEERSRGAGPASTGGRISLHPIPPGTRDVLPDEMRELRAITRGLRRAFEGAGYGEVWTPALEYEDVLRTGDETAAGAGFRTFDDKGHVLALRSDMTIPIARVVATRFRDLSEELRLCYFAHAYRAVDAGTGQQREFFQAGVELVGIAGPEAEAEVIALTLEALDGVGLKRHRIGLGDGALYRTLLDHYGIEEDGLLERLAVRDLVGLARRVKEAGIPAEAERVLLSLPEKRGGPEVLEEPIDALDGLRELYAELEAKGVADRVILDLGLVRMLGYYTGAVYEVYDPAVGFTLGGGGRYDDLIGRFGAPRPACGVALDVQRVHVAQAAEEAME